MFSDPHYQVVVVDTEDDFDLVITPAVITMEHDVVEYFGKGGYVLRIEWITQIKTISTGRRPPRTDLLTCAQNGFNYRWPIR